MTLRQVILKGCKRLQQFPKELGKLTNLETLDVLCSGKLCELPMSIGGLRMLTMLDMHGTRVRDLLADFGLLSSLTKLHLPQDLCNVLETFQGLEALTSLSKSSLWISRGFVDLGNLGAFTALKELDISSCAGVTILPKSLGNFEVVDSLEDVEVP